MSDLAHRLEANAALIEMGEKIAWNADVDSHTVAQIRAERGIDVSQPNWTELFAKAFAAYDAMMPEQKAAHDAAQKASFIKGMGPCEHGVYDFETCPDCRGEPRHE